MQENAQDLFGQALDDYSNGDTSAEIIICRDDGFEAPLPIAHFFRDSSEFSPIEKQTISLCKGNVLDAGGGAGSISLALQQKGFSVTAMDISSEAINVMKKRGVKKTACVDIFKVLEDDYRWEFDTILMMGHGVGMVETVEGLDRFLKHAKNLLTEDGHVLLDSVDVRITDDPKHLKYHKMNERENRYRGEVRLCFEYKGQTGAPFGWLHVDAETLKHHTEAEGWLCEVLCEEKNGDYLARLTVKGL